MKRETPMDPIESKMVKSGHKPVTACQLQELMIEKPMQGEYLGGFRFIIYFSADGSMEGINHVGSHNHGSWTIDSKLGTLGVQWDNGWEANTSRAYYVDDILSFFDITSGLWRNNLRIVDTSFGRKHLASGEWQIE